MNSKIYFGRVRHRRFSPKEHSFGYAMFMLYLDLDEFLAVPGSRSLQQEFQSGCLSKYNTEACISFSRVFVYNQNATVKTFRTVSDLQYRDNKTHGNPKSIL